MLRLKYLLAALLLPLAAHAKPSASAIKVTPQMLRGKIVYSTQTESTSALWAIGDDGRGRRLVLSGPENMNLDGAQFSPDLRLLAFDQFIVRDLDAHSREAASGIVREVTSEIVLVNLSQGRRRVLKRSGKHDHFGPIRFSPDGKKLLYTIWRRLDGQPQATANRAEVRVIELRSGRDQRMTGSLRNPASPVEGLAWSRDGKRILLAPDRGLALPAELAARSERRLRTSRLDGSGVQPFNAQWNGYRVSSVSPDGRWRCVQVEQTVVLRYPGPNTPLPPTPLLLQSTRGRRSRRVAMAPEADLERAVWKPNSRALALQWHRTSSRSVTQGPDNVTETTSTSGISIVRRDGTLQRHLLFSSAGFAAGFGTNLVAWLP